MRSIVTEVNPNTCNKIKYPKGSILTCINHFKHNSFKLFVICCADIITTHTYFTGVIVAIEPDALNIEESCTNKIGELSNGWILSEFKEVNLPFTIKYTT